MENSNQRVTNAVLKKDIETLTKTVEDLTTIVRGRLDDHESRIRANEKYVIGAAERWKQETRMQRVYATIAAAAAGALSFLLDK